MARVPLSHKPRRTWLMIIAIPILLMVAWTGTLDNQSTNYVNKAMIGAGAVYATARGINAVVSVLQGTELDAFFITLTVGELLDPVNDLIERFSGVMLIALGSLAMQRILLELVTHTTFNILLTLMGAGTAAAVLWGDQRRDRCRILRGQ